MDRWKAEVEQKNREEKGRRGEDQRRERAFGGMVLKFVEIEKPWVLFWNPGF